MVLLLDMRKVYVSELVMYINVLFMINERFLLIENNVFLYVIEVLIIGGEWKILIKVFFLKEILIVVFLI